MTAEGCWKGLGVPGSCGNGKEKQGRGDEQRRGGGRRGLFVDRVRFLVALSASSPSGLGLGPWRLWARFLVSFCPFCSRGGVRVGAYKAGWEGGRWGKRAGRVGVGDSAEPGLWEVMALRDARSRWPGLGQTMIAEAGDAGAALGPGVVSL